MSSPFQQKFSAKSPLNGNYYSGVDGLQYVSPKIPESKTPEDPIPKTKSRKTIIPPTETPNTRDGGGNQKINDFSDDEDKFVPVQETENRTLEDVISNIIPATDNETYLKSFEAGFAKDNLGFNNITDYRKFKEKENNERSKQKVLTDQERLITGMKNERTGEIVWDDEKGDWVNIQNN